MAEYIEREKLIDELEHLHEDAELSYLGVYDCVENAPTADVVPVKWISVKDRLPDNDIRVLVAVDSDKSDTKIDTDRMIYRQWVRWGMSVTHWMSLPEPPKKPKEEESAE